MRIVRLQATPALLRSRHRGHSQLGLDRALLLDLLNLGAQPAGQSFFQFGLTAGAVEVVHCLPLFCQLDKAAGYTFGPPARGDKLLQQAGLAGMRTRRVAEIRAHRRIFKNGRSAPGRRRRASITSVFQKAEFEPEDVQNITIVFVSHRAPQLEAACQTWTGTPVYSITGKCD